MKTKEPRDCRNHANAQAPHGLSKTRERHRGKHYEFIQHPLSSFIGETPMRFPATGANLNCPGFLK